MKHNEPETMCSLEWLEHERRKAWQEGYAAGWKEHCDWIYGLAWRYTDGSGIVSASRPDNPVPIAIMNSHVRLATSFDEHETGTTKQSEDTNMKETNR